MSERILGRGAELQQIGALLADEAPTARALVLTGDAGIGKTTIWEEGVRLAGQRGLRVLGDPIDRARRGLLVARGEVNPEAAHHRAAQYPGQQWLHRISDRVEPPPVAI